jgi:hypothetical protein
MVLVGNGVVSRELELQGNRLTGVWECSRDWNDQDNNDEDNNDSAWPLLQELAVDCLTDMTTTTETPVTGAAGIGVDMSKCDVCCIKCF